MQGFLLAQLVLLGCHSSYPSCDWKDYCQQSFNGNWLQLHASRTRHVHNAAQCPWSLRTALTNQPSSICYFKHQVKDARQKMKDDRLPYSNPPSKLRSHLFQLQRPNPIGYISKLTSLWVVLYTVFGASAGKTDLSALFHWRWKSGNDARHNQPGSWFQFWWNFMTFILNDWMYIYI